MGLPQTASSEQSQEALSAPSCSLSQSLPVYATSHVSDGVNRGSEGGICSSIGEFDRKTSLEPPLEFTDDSCRFHGTRIVTSSSAHGLTSYATEKVSSSLIGARRIVGFASSETSSLDNKQTSVAVDHSLSYTGGVTGVDIGGALVRKRVLSPLNTLFPVKFRGDLLDIRCGNHQQITYSGQSSEFCNSVAQDQKKGNTSSRLHLSTTPTTTSTSSCWEWKNAANSGRLSSMVFTDGPLLDSVDLHRTTKGEVCLYSPLYETSGTPNKPLPYDKEISVSPPLCLSPLGPKFSERIKPVTSGQNGTILDDLRNISEEAELRIDHRLFDDAYALRRAFSMERSTESAPASPCKRFIRSLSGRPIQRSLVGSFEESLLTGRLSCGPTNQVFIFNSDALMTHFIGHKKLHSVWFVRIYIRIMCSFRNWGLVKLAIADNCYRFNLYMQQLKGKSRYHHLAYAKAITSELSSLSKKEIFFCFLFCNFDS